MNSKLIAMATCLALPVFFAGAAQAQYPTSDPACELGIRHLSSELPNIGNEQTRMDVKKLYDEAVVAQKANDANGCNDKLDMAMHRGNVMTGMSMPGSFMAMDMNRDGMISRDEYTTFHGTQYRQAMDMNRDGTITRDEYMTFRGTQYRDMSGRTRTTYDTDTTQYFVQGDRNNDGRLSNDEIDAMPRDRM